MKSCSSTSFLATSKSSAYLTCARSFTPTWGRSSRVSTKPLWTRATSPAARKARVPSTRCFGVLALVFAFIVGCVLMVALINYSDFAICLPLALAVPAIGLIFLARYMPRKSPAGAEEAAKWLAFKRYMEDIEKYTKVDEVKEIFDRYLPYAIAFGLENSWIQKFSRVDTAQPPWFYPGPYLGPAPARLCLVGRRTDGRRLRRILCRRWKAAKRPH